MDNNSSYYISRMLAFFVDRVFLLIMFMIITSIPLIYMSFTMSKHEFDKITFDINNIYFRTAIISYYLFQILYFVVFQGKYKMTLGKYIFKLRLSSINGKKISYFAMLIRYILYSLLPILMVSFIFIFIDKHFQTIHDKAAGTCVVWKDAINPEIDTM